LKKLLSNILQQLLEDVLPSFLSSSVPDVGGVFVWELGSLSFIFLVEDFTQLGMFTKEQESMSQLGLCVGKLSAEVVMLSHRREVNSGA
jgi:hypothetical protein